MGEGGYAPKLAILCPCGYLLELVIETMDQQAKIQKYISNWQLSSHSKVEAQQLLLVAVCWEFYIRFHPAPYADACGLVPVMWSH